MSTIYYGTDKTGKPVYESSSPSAAPDPSQATPAANVLPTTPPPVKNPAVKLPIPSTPSNDLSFPSVDLQPGARGTDVQKLQEYLVKNGALSTADMATGPGIYGPKTQAAVASLQQKLGVDVSTDAGYFGPKTRAALGNQSSPTEAPQATTSPVTETSGANPVSDFISTYTSTLDALGVNSIKQEFEKVQKEYSDIQDELDGKIADVNENPWLSESVRQKEVDKLKTRYDAKLTAKSNQAKLYESLYTEGTATAKYLTTGEVAQQQDLLTMAEKRAEAQSKLDNPSISEKYGTGAIGEYNFAKSQGYTGSFTQYQNEDANRKAKATSSNEPRTEGERVAQKLGTYAQAFQPGARLPDGTAVVDSNGYITPVAWKQAITDATTQGISRKDFITQYGPQIYTLPDGTIPSTYGITNAEKKLIAGS